MPSPRTELHYENPFSAFPTPEALAAGTQEQIFDLIKSCSYPNNKTKSLMGMARKLVDDFGGEVPDDIDSLMSLPGVGRKTANVILSVVFNHPAMAVDTHVFRVAERIGLTTRSKSVRNTEKELTDRIPDEVLSMAHHWLILHGRYVCKARKPQCDRCFIADVCRYHEREVAREARAVARLRAMAEKADPKQD